MALSYQDIENNPCAGCPGAREAGICDDCADNPETRGKDRRYYYGIKDIPKMVKDIMAVMEYDRDINGVAILDKFDIVDLRDVSAEYTGLKKWTKRDEQGRQIYFFDPHEKAKKILTAAAFYWLKRKDNRIERICNPLPHYPELCADVNEVCKAVKVVPIRRERIKKMVDAAQENTPRPISKIDLHELRMGKLIDIWAEMQGMRKYFYAEPDDDKSLYYLDRYYKLMREYEHLQANFKAVRRGDFYAICSDCDENISACFDFEYQIQSAKYCPCCGGNNIRRE
jgi:hypothetical protein